MGYGAFYVICLMASCQYVTPRCTVIWSTNEQGDQTIVLLPNCLAYENDRLQAAAEQLSRAALYNENQTSSAYNVSSAGRPPPPCSVATEPHHFLKGSSDFVSNS